MLTRRTTFAGLFLSAVTFAISPAAAQNFTKQVTIIVPYAPGGNPFLGQKEKINAAKYLAGGAPFGPGLFSANITPNARGLPAGLTYSEFQNKVMRKGQDPDEPGEILQVMPWPVYAKMTNCDLLAIYQFLRAIPSRPYGG